MREFPSSLQDDPTRVWDCLWYVRRLVQPKAGYYWALRLQVPERLGAEGIAALEAWWGREHYQLSDRQRKARRAAGGGNVFLLRVGRDAVLLTNGPRAFARELLQRMRREVFWTGFRSLPSMSLHHLRDGLDWQGFRIVVPRPPRPKKGEPVVLERRSVMVVPSPATLQAFRETVWSICRWREGRGRWARKPETVIRQFNAFAAAWWTRHQYCDWEPGQVAYWQQWARLRLARKVAQEMRRRLSRFKRRATRKAASASEKEAAGALRGDIRSPQGVTLWVYQQAVTFRHRRVWRLGQEVDQVEIPPSDRESLAAWRQERGLRAWESSTARQGGTSSSS